MIESLKCPHCSSSNIKDQYVMDEEKFCGYDIVTYSMLCNDCKNHFCAEFKNNDKEYNFIKSYLY